MSTPSRASKKAFAWRTTTRTTSLWAMTTTDGQHWSQPIDMHAPIVPNHGPQPTRSGRLVISGNISFPYSDDPSGLSGWTMTGIYPADMAGRNLR